MQFNKHLFKGTHLFILALLVFNFSCKIKNPTEGFSITIRPDAVSAPNSFSFVNAKTGQTDQNLEGVLVKITGPSAPYLYTSDGYQNFKIIAGQIGVCIRKGVNPSPSSPIVFEIAFEAPGYMSKTFRQELTSLIPVSQSLAVVDLDDLQKTASKKDTTFTVTSSGITDTLRIVSPATDSLNSIQCKLKPGTKFVDANNNAYSGAVSSELLYSKPSGGEDDDNALATFPLDIFHSEYTDSVGNPINAVFFPFEMTSLNFTGGGKAGAVVFADSDIKIDPFDNENTDQLIIDSKGKTKISSNKDSGLVANTLNMIRGTRSFSGVINQTVRFEPEEYFPYYKLYIRNYVRDKYDKRSYAFRSVKVSPSVAPITYKTVSDIKVTTKVRIRDQSGRTVKRVILSGPSDVVTLPKPPGILNFYIAQFAVYCNDQQAYMVLPEGWNVYLIERSKYFSTIIPDSKGGHRIQPSDDPDGEYFLQVSAESPITQDGITYNKLKIPIGSDLIKDDTEYIVCTLFGSQGLIFNDFNNPAGQMRTPAGLKATVNDFIGPVNRMTINKCGK